jgi:hypothetical protein
MTHSVSGPETIVPILGGRGSGWCSCAVQDNGDLAGVDDVVDDLQEAVTTWRRAGGDVDGEDTGKQGPPGPRLHAVGSGRRSVAGDGQQPAGEVEQRQLLGEHPHLVAANGPASAVGSSALAEISSVSTSSFVGSASRSVSAGESCDHQVRRHRERFEPRQRREGTRCGRLHITSHTERLRHPLELRKPARS